MYNRYIRNDNGSYTRIPDQPRQGQSSPPPPKQEHREPPREEHHHAPPPPPSRPDGLSGVLRHLLDQFHLDGVDTGDLLLLGLLFLLSREEADEELLIALGLLLIL